MGYSKKSKKQQKQLAIIVAPLVLLIAISIYGVIYLYSTLGVDSTKDIVINEQNVGSASQQLADSGYIEHPLIFTTICKAYSILSGRKFTQGEYRIMPSMTYARFMRMLYSGNQSYTVNVVIPEGLSLKKIASIYKKKLGMDSILFVKLTQNDSILKKYGIPGKSLEGYCMPDTYNFFWKQKPHEIIQKMIAVHSVFWDDECSQKLKQQLLTKHQILTLASIIEAEASVAEERKIISGVYHNRLRRGMKLEADPTVQYAIGKQKRLVYSDLKSESRYNTYRYVGLPPGPINCPGRASILAALEPEQHRFIFFVALGDGSGRHVFSRTAQEHGKAVANYRKNRKS